MIGKFGSNGWCALNPMMTERTNREFEAQAVMIVAEVIKATHNVHTIDKGSRTVGQGAGSSDQAVQMHSNSGIEPFDESCVDYTLSIF